MSTRRDTQPQDDITRFDPSSPEEPTPQQVEYFMEQVLPNHERAARARGLEGRVFVKIGILTDPDNPKTIDGPPKNPDGDLLQSAWQLGSQVRLPDSTAWTVQNNLIQPIWVDGNRYANVVTLVRPDPKVPGSRLPAIPTGFQDIEPMSLAHCEIDSSQLPTTVSEKSIRLLLNLATGWGDWSRLPYSEIAHALENDGEEEAVIAPELTELHRKGYIRLEEAARGRFINFLPKFIRLLLQE